MKKAQKEAIAAFMRLDEFKSWLDCHYIVGYKDFHFDAEKAYLEMAFDSFKIPTATKSSLLLASFEDVNMVDDASIELA